MKLVEIFNSHKNNELYLCRCGIEDCYSDQFWGPAVRDHFVIHYILNGKGSYTVNNCIYHLEKGMGFISCPNVLGYYKADSYEPWTYSWIAFNGTMAETYLQYSGLSEDNPILCSNDTNFFISCVKNMMDTKKLSVSRDIELTGLLYLFISYIIELPNSTKVKKSNAIKNYYVEKAVKFIEMNFSRNINIQDISNHIGITRRYLSALFKISLDLTPQDFLINTRIDHACNLMYNKNLSIGDISRSVGYQDQLMFSRIFKKIKGIPPSQYRYEINNL